jgi:N-acyl-L-homoserine lactone synthetase
MLRLYRRIGCEVDVLGRTDRYGAPVYLGLFPVSQTILAEVNARLRAPPAIAGAEHGHRAAA